MQPIVAAPSITQRKQTKSKPHKKVQYDSEYEREKRMSFETVKDDIEKLVLSRVKNLPHNAFIYLKYSVSKSSVKFTPYSLM